MIIVGDLACPNEACAENLRDIFISHSQIFGNSPLVCNLEGMISDNEQSNTATPILFSHSSVVKVLHDYKTVVAAMANNHTLDLPDRYRETRELLSSRGIGVCGVGNSDSEAAMPIRFQDQGKEVILFNSCWDFLLYHQTNPVSQVYVAETKPMALIEEIGSLRSQNAKAKIVVYFHWNFDLETLPFPMHRVFGKALIDAGANLVVGTHSHCVQGAERYKDGYIVYGMGNFFVPSGVFANGRLKYPEFANVELVCDWDVANNQMIFHWFQYAIDQGRHTLRHLESSSFGQSELMKKYSPFQNMENDEYAKFFRKNRRKKMLIPIFQDHRLTVRNGLNTEFLKIRARLARSLAKVNLLSWSK